MVTFSCDLCADTVKKPKTLQHLYRCPDAQFTCIDCLTTFHGDNYLSHTSCISEAEKYQKGLYKGNKKNKQDTSNKQKQQQKVGTLNSINKHSLEGGEQSNTLNGNNKTLKGSEQDQIPNIITDNNKNHSQESNLKKKRKNKNKKNQQQDNQSNKNKINIKKEKEEEKDIAVTNDYNNEAQETLDTTINHFVSSSTKKKRKNKKSMNNINGHNAIKVEESKKDNNDVLDLNELQLVQTYMTNETQKKEKDIENPNNSSSKKKKKKRKNDSINKNNNNLANPNGINETDQSLVGILKKKESSDGKNKKRKSVEFMLPELSTNNSKTTNENVRNAKKSKLSHENDLSNYYESVPTVVKKIFKSNEYEELNLKRLEEMVVRQLIAGSNSSESELKEKFLENIVLTMKDGKIILK